MTSTINGSTPQLKLVDKLFEAYRTCDLKNTQPLLSNFFTFKTFPKVSDLPDEAKEEHFENYTPRFEPLIKFEHLFHEVIEAPGKVVVQFTALLTPPDGATFEYDSVCIFTLIEEEGELKVLEAKDFSDPEKRKNFHKTMSQLQAGKAA